MRVVKRLFDFYINSSIHVAVAVLSLVLMTNHMFHNPFDMVMAGFVFFGTIFGYNFVKYESLFRNRKPIRKRLKAMVFLSLLSFLTAFFCFFELERITQIVAVVFFGLTFLYTVPFFPNKENIRNWSGVKIYIVAFCWAGITILLPLINAGIAISIDVFLKFGQRFLLVIILILIFEIIDLKTDDPSLMTVPQKIGVKQTKKLGYILLIIFCGLEFFNSNININFNKINGNINFQSMVLQLALIFAIAIVSALFTFFAHPNRSKYYTSFWVESIPIFWWILVLIFKK